MTNDKLSEIKKILKDFIDGKQLQSRKIGSNGTWFYEDKDFVFDFIKFEYRVAPEPKYIPFDFSDAEFLIGKIVKSKDGSVVSMIVGVGNASGVCVGDVDYDFNELLDTYTFLDGTPCGKISDK